MPTVQTPNGPWTSPQARSIIRASLHPEPVPLQEKTEVELLIPIPAPADEDDYLYGRPRR
jgi:hypothetical protein